MNRFRGTELTPLLFLEPAQGVYAERAGARYGDRCLGYGAVPKGFVSPRPGRVPAAADILAHCRDVLAHFRCPKALGSMELPKTSTGKVQKLAPHEREWAGRDERIH